MHDICRQQGNGGKKGLGGGAVAGIVIGVLLALALVGLLAGLLIARRRKQVAGGPAAGQGSTKSQKSGERTCTQ